jgi:hypothetical protein
MFPTKPAVDGANVSFLVQAGLSNTIVATLNAFEIDGTRLNPFAQATKRAKKTVPRILIFFTYG